MDSRSGNWIKSGNWTRDYDLYQDSFSQHTYNSSLIYGHFRQSVFIGYPLILHLGTSCSINHLHISLQVRAPWLQIQIFCLLQKLCNLGSLPPPDLYYFRILLSPLLLELSFVTVFSTNSPGHQRVTITVSWMVTPLSSSTFHFSCIFTSLMYLIAFSKFPRTILARC